MATSNCPALGPRDSLRRDDLIPVNYSANRLTFGLVVAALAGVAFGILANLIADPSSDPLNDPLSDRDRERAAVAESAAPGTVLDGHGKWGGYTK